MTSQRHECPKCRATMEEGFLLDRTHGGCAQSTWVLGPARSSFWTGLKLKGQPKLSVATYRCSRCGYLESYAVGAVKS